MVLIVLGIFQLKKSIRPEGFQMFMDDIEQIKVVDYKKFSTAKKGDYIGYKTNNKSCPLEWLLERKQNSDAITLRLKFDYKNPCQYSFEQQKKIHRQIFKRVFVDFKPQQIQKMELPSLRYLQKDMSWNEILINQSAKINDKNLHEKKTKALEQLALSFLKDSLINKKLNSLGQLEGMKLKLSHVEKVFFLKDGAVAEKIKKENQNLIYDVGMIYLQRDES